MKTIIKELIDENINPSLAEHAGAVELVSVETEEDHLVVTVKYQGACVGCPSSTAGTLRMIEFFLREELTAPNLEVRKQEDIYPWG